MGRIFVTSHSREIFQTEDVKALFQKCQGVRLPDETDFDEFSNDLNFIAIQFFSSCLRRTAQTPANDEKWFRGIVRHAGQLLAAFGVKKSLDRPDNNSVHMLVIAADVPAQREDLYLRNKMAAEIGARDVLGEWTAIRIALYGLQTMMARAEHGAAIAARDKGAPRKAPAEEVYLVGALHGLYVRVTGDKRWYTVDDGVPGGPFVEFVQAVAAHIHDNLDAADPPMPAELARNLETLSKSARRIVDRIRRVPKRWKGTNQSQPS